MGKEQLRDEQGTFTRKEQIGEEQIPFEVTGENKSHLKRNLYISGLALIAALGGAGIGYGIFRAINNDPKPTRPVAESTTLGVTSTTEAVTTTVAQTSTTTEVQSEVDEKTAAAEAFLAEWPKTAEEAAKKFGGDASQWQRNPDWSDTRTIDNPNLGIFGFINREWRYTDPENLPFEWPETAEEALAYFFPGQNIDVRFIQPAWTNPETGVIEGWHLSEDHWLFESDADVNLVLHNGEVAEGYSVNGTQEPEDDRNWVAFGGFGNENIKGVSILARKGQGWTIWMPGTDPNAIALRMELFVEADTPYYRGENGEQLGPIAINFPPIYPAPASK
jgi:hypothetical protein